MSYAGSVADMINKIKENRALLHVSKVKKERLQSVMLTNFHVKKYKHELHKEDLTDAQKATIMAKIMADIEKSERRLALLRLPIIFMLVLFVIFSLWLTFDY